MAYCSVDEAWGKPLSDSFDQHTMQSKLELENETQKNALRKADMNEVSNMKGLLLGDNEYYEPFTKGISEKDEYLNLSENKVTEKPHSLKTGNPAHFIHSPTFEKKEKNEYHEILEFKSILNEKFDLMIDLLSKKTCTSWTDVLIFVFLGLFTILILELFFRMGKSFLKNKTPSFSGATSNYYPMMPQMGGMGGNPMMNHQFSGFRYP